MQHKQILHCIALMQSAGSCTVKLIAQHGPLLLQVTELAENTELTQPNLVMFSFFLSFVNNYEN